MDEAISQRCVTIARYMIEHRTTVRQAARVYGLSKSCIHKDMICRLPQINADLGREVASLLRYNKSVRHLRGGEATRLRYHPERTPAGT